VKLAQARLLAELAQAKFKVLTTSYQCYKRHIIKNTESRRSNYFTPPAHPHPHTRGNVGSFVGGKKFVGMDVFILKHIHQYQYQKPTNIGYIRRFGLGTDEYIGRPG
jgi:hypothetical protein